MMQLNATIMLVEDSTSQATRFIAILENEGWQVRWASKPEEAFDYLRHNTPSLLLLDYYLPGMRGDEICRRIRRNTDSRSLPIVMLTAEEGHELQGLDSGADDFISKLVEPEILVLKIKALLQRQHTEHQHTEQKSIEDPSPDDFRSARILAVDDSATFLARLKPELENEGYELVTTQDPYTSLKLVEANEFDGVIIDLVMPVMNGIEVCKKINEIRKAKDLSLVTLMLTSAETNENLSNALEAGADDFVGKSNDFAILKGRIRALLRRKFFAEENRRILQKLRLKELEATRERVAKEAAQTRAALVEKLQESTAELKRSREELTRANEAKDQFMAVLSHELRTPLTPILALLSHRCNDTSLPAHLLEELQLIKRNVELEARLIDDLLDITKIAKGKLEIRDDEVTIDRVISHAVSMCNTGEHHATISYFPESTDIIVRGDALRLTQVIWNLLRNAIKFTPPSGTIEISLHQDRSTPHPNAKIHIKDSGIGIAPELLAKVFDAFEQGGRKTTKQFGGLGLGLAISKAIMDLHRGEIQAHSAGTNQGTTFTVSLPVMNTPALDTLLLPACTPAKNSQPPPSTEKASISILLLEDHHDTRNVMARLLKLRGHKVIPTSSVSEVIEAAKNHSDIGLLISDLGLPDGTGFDALIEVKKYHQIPTIALSGFGMEGDIQRSLKAGFTVHLTKPINFETLESEIQRICVAY